MKLYRSIDFSKLIFLQDEVGRVRWNAFHQEKRAKKEYESFNWWFDQHYVNQRRELISRIFQPDGEKRFFEKSIIHNSLQGGRFNPAKSFGGIYMANEHIVSCLEVLFHIFYDSYPIYKGLEKNESKITSCFDIRIPDKIRSLIITFEIELDDIHVAHDLNGNRESLKKDCSQIGFARYIGDNFDRNFIFGNDYEIARILGCYFFTKTSSTFKVPSARLDIDMQDDLGLRNIFLPEKDFEKANPKLTGSYYEFLCEVDMVPAKRKHDIEITCIGSDTQKTFNFKLEEIPPKQASRSSIIYMPNGVSLTFPPFSSRKK
jgi:hypothetical protein